MGVIIQIFELQAYLRKRRQQYWRTFWFFVKYNRKSKCPLKPWPFSRLVTFKGRWEFTLRTILETYTTAPTLSYTDFQPRSLNTLKYCVPICGFLIEKETSGLQWLWSSDDLTCLTRQGTILTKDFKSHKDIKNLI